MVRIQHCPVHTVVTPTLPEGTRNMLRFHALNHYNMCLVDQLYHFCTLEWEVQVLLQTRTYLYSDMTIIKLTSTVSYVGTRVPTYETVLAVDGTHCVMFIIGEDLNFAKF